MNHGVVLWCNKKRTCVVLSSMKVEFMTCSIAVQEGICIERFVKHLDLTPDVKAPIDFQCHNQAAIAFAKNPRFHNKTKHIDTQCKYLRDMLQGREMSLSYISNHIW